MLVCVCYPIGYVCIVQVRLAAWLTDYSVIASRGVPVNEGCLHPPSLLLPAHPIKPG